MTWNQYKIRMVLPFVSQARRAKPILFGFMFGDKANPNGSAVIYDEYGKPIDYRTGKVPATRADWHIPGGNKVPVQGLPPWWRGE
jgi:hypothetical protein